MRSAFIIIPLLSQCGEWKGSTLALPFPSPVAHEACALRLTEEHIKITNGVVLLVLLDIH